MKSILGKANSGKTTQIVSLIVGKKEETCLFLSEELGVYHLSDILRREHPDLGPIFMSLPKLEVCRVSSFGDCCKHLIDRGTEFQNIFIDGVRINHRKHELEILKFIESHLGLNITITQQANSLSTIVGTITVDS